MLRPVAEARGPKEDTPVLERPRAEAGTAAVLVAAAVVVVVVVVVGAVGTAIGTFLTGGAVTLRTLENFWLCCAVIAVS